MTSDFRLVTEYLAYKNDPEELEKFMENTCREIKHPEEFLDIMSEVASDNAFYLQNNVV